MNMRTLLILAVLFPCLNQISFAAPPPGTAYDNFNVVGGAIAAPCPSNFQCTDIATGAGFLQREIISNDPTNQHYIQTITVDPDANGMPADLPLSMESFIQNSPGGGTTNTVNGYSGRETVLDTSVASEFTETTAIDNGWAAQAGQANVRIGQSILSGQNQPGQTFTDQYSYQANHDTSGFRSGTSIDIQQGLNLSDAGNGSPDDQQNYSYQHLQGDMNVNDGSLTLPNGSVLSWSAGDSITHQQTSQILAPTGTTDQDFPGSFEQFDFAENQTTNTEVRSSLQSDTGTVIPPDPPFPSF